MSDKAVFWEKKTTSEPFVLAKQLNVLARYKLSYQFDNITPE
jgi:hypothetical protein